MYYRDGTTDIARNFVYGIPTERHKVLIHVYFMLNEHLPTHPLSSIASIGAGI